MTRRLFPALFTMLFALLSWGGAIAGAQTRIAVRTEPGTPVVATEILLAAGPADEPSDKAGLAYLSARAVTAPVLPTLDSLGAHLEVGAAKDAVTFTLTAAPDVWEEAIRTLLVALFRDPPQGSAVLREKAAVNAELASRASNPGDAIVREVDAAIFGKDHPWGRATVGTPTTVGKLSLEDVNRFLRQHFTADRAVAAVVGPIEAPRARQVLGAYLEASGPIERDTLSPSPARSPVRRDYNSITTWVAVSYPFPAQVDLEALRLLAQLAIDELAFSPSRQTVFNARGDVFPRLGGGELRFQLVTPPDEAGQWADRIRDVVAGVTDRPMLADVFEARLRRYRGERLLALAAPEERARELARALLVSGTDRTTLPELESLTVARLRAAASSLGDPTVILLGPFLDETAQAKER